MSENPNQTEETGFEHVSGRLSEGERTRKRQIAQGHYGVIYETDLIIDGRKHAFAEKLFKNNEYGTAEENAQRAFENYRMAQEAGLRVLPTYRLSADQKSILMTAYFGDWACVAGNANPTLEELGTPRMKSIDNFSALLKTLFDEALKAAQHRIQFGNDLFLFLVNKQNPNSLDFLSGDVDQILTNVDEDEKTILAFNLEGIKVALKSFLEFNVENPESYTQKLGRYYKETARQHDLL
jgi:hypothetical protein